MENVNRWSKLLGGWLEAHDTMAADRPEARMDIPRAEWAQDIREYMETVRDCSEDAVEGYPPPELEQAERIASAVEEYTKELDTGNVTLAYHHLMDTVDELQGWED